MGKVTVDFSMSLDGFVAGPKQTLEQALGEGGERLHEWAFAAASFRENHGLPGGIGAALEQARAAAGDKDGRARVHQGDRVTHRRRPPSVSRREVSCHASDRGGRRR